MVMILIGLDGAVGDEARLRRPVREVLRQHQVHVPASLARVYKPLGMEYQCNDYVD
jgi:hypothetical protein